jgi:hypothetical protein
MSRLSEAQAKYPDIAWDTIKLIDPSKNFKYLNWIGSNFKSSSADEIKNLLSRFEKIKDKLSEKDIVKYDVSSLKTAIEGAGKSNSEEKIAGAVYLPDVEGAKIVLLEGEKAVKSFTAGTRWCISSFVTFKSYAYDKNIFVAAKNKTKFAIVTQGSEVQVFAPDDVSIPNGTLKYVSQFCDDGGLSKIIDSCKEYTKTNKNIWYTINNGPFTTETIDKALSLIKADNLIDNLISKNRLRSFCKIIADNREKYKDLAATLASSKRETNERKPDNNDSYFRVNYSYFRVNEIWKEMSMTDEEKKKIAAAAKKKKDAEKRKKLIEDKKKKEKVIANIKKAGGIAKFLEKNKKLIDQISNL